MVDDLARPRYERMHDAPPVTADAHATIGRVPNSRCRCCGACDEAGAGLCRCAATERLRRDADQFSASPPLVLCEL